ncbi:hypothetical protein OBV_33010 [Oscillibacter valericigenes Sjm18-20]|nr:hypothetical protein OBV_33010 [Oscillibacter valericigenes Sjm18-20]
MAKCIRCGQAAAYSFRVLEVQTLHIRDMTGEKRVQALGNFQDYGVCRTCAAARLAKIQKPGVCFFRNCASFGAILAMGLILVVLFGTSNGALRLMGIAAVGCGILGEFSTVQSFKKKRKTYAALEQKDALLLAALDVLMDSNPKKAMDSDLTYIPVDEKTLAMKNGDLMIAYKLLPEIAIKAYNLIHGKSANDE